MEIGNLTLLVSQYVVSADELEAKVLKAEENGDRTKIDGYLTGALKVLRSNRSKPDPAMCLSLFCLVKRRQHLFRSHRVMEVIKIVPDTDRKRLHNATRFFCFQK